MKSPEPVVPLIIPRSDHPISRQNIDREALKVLHRLRDAGFTAYLVGGGVRDLYLGKTPKDFDISTDAKPGQLRHIFRNSRIIGRRFRLVQVFFPGGKIVEVSTFRSRSEEEPDQIDPVLAANNSFGTAVEDAFRRDLTINALFYEIENFSIIDYVGGVADLNNKIIRMVGEPERRITRDPVRMLRAIRHAARSGFVIEEQTWLAIKAHYQDLTICPVSRIRDEFFRDLTGGASSAWAQLAMDCRIFFVILPWYEKVLADPRRGQESRQLLLAILAVADRLNRGCVTFHEDRTLGLLLLPWALAEFKLLEAQPDAAKAYKLSRKIRSRLDEILVNLNIKKATLESITSLLATLPLLAHHEKGEKWPTWLSRKSYFEKSLAFYRIYQEATGGPEVEVAIPPPPPQPEFFAELEEPSHPPRPERGRRGRRGRFSEEAPLDLAAEGPVDAQELLPTPLESEGWEDTVEPVWPEGERSRSSRHGNRVPAFSASTGGVFGLKKSRE